MQNLAATLKWCDAITAPEYAVNRRAKDQVEATLTRLQKFAQGSNRKVNSFAHNSASMRLKC